MTNKPIFHTVVGVGSIDSFPDMKYTDRPEHINHIEFEGYLIMSDIIYSVVLYRYAHAPYIYWMEFVSDIDLIKFLICQIDSDKILTAAKFKLCDSEQNESMHDIFIKLIK